MSDTAEKQTHDIIVEASYRKTAYLAVASYGHATRKGVGNGDAIRAGAGIGHAVRYGAGSGDAIRIGTGRGSALRGGAGRGDAIRTGTGSGNAVRYGEGDGDAFRYGEGDGDAFRYDKGDGNAIRKGTGNGIALILGKVGDGCFEQDSRGKRFPETIYYDDSRDYLLNVREINGVPFFTAGCRRFSLKEALEHWGDGYTGTGDNKAYVQAIENWVANSGGE